MKIWPALIILVLVCDLAVSKVLTPVTPESESRSFSSEENTTLSDLDAILDVAPNLDAFLENEDLQNRYFEALTKYYGSDKVNAASLGPILVQLKSLVKSVPQLKERLWEKATTGTRFQIESAVQTSGRELKGDNWQAFLTSWDQGLRERAELKADGDVNSLSDDLEAYSATYEQNLKIISKSVATVSKRQAQAEIGKFINAERANPNVKKLAARLVLRYFAKEETKDLLNSGDADVILDFIETLRSTISSSILFENEIPSLPSPLISEIKALVPGKSDLLKDESIFKISMRKTRSGLLVPVGSGGTQAYSFEPLPRRIHGIWKGISIGECVGGLTPEELTPERWATAVLKDTQFYAVHQGSSYLGFIQIVPVSHEGHIFGSVDFGASVLTRKVIVRDKQNHTPRFLRLFDLWLMQMRRNLPKNWSGLVVGKSGAISNAGVLPTVRESLAYSWGVNVTDGSPIKHLDPVAAEIVKNAGRQTKIQRIYGGNMIFDAGVPNAGSLTRLTYVTPDFYANDRKLKAGLINGTGKFKAQLLNGLPVPIPSLSNQNLALIVETYKRLPPETLTPEAATWLLNRITDPDTKMDLFAIAVNSIKSGAHFKNVIDLSRSLKSLASGTLAQERYTEAVLSRFSKETYTVLKEAEWLKEQIRNVPAGLRKKILLKFAVGDRNPLFKTLILEQLLEEPTLTPSDLLLIAKTDTFVRDNRGVLEYLARSAVRTDQALADVMLDVFLRASPGQGGTLDAKGTTAENYIATASPEEKILLRQALLTALTKPPKNQLGAIEYRAEQLARAFTFTALTKQDQLRVLNLIGEQWSEKDPFKEANAFLAFDLSDKNILFSVQRLLVERKISSYDLGGLLPHMKTATPEFRTFLELLKPDWHRVPDKVVAQAQDYLMRLNSQSMCKDIFVPAH